MDIVVKKLVNTRKKSRESQLSKNSTKNEWT